MSNTNELRMTLFACWASGWGRLQYLEDKSSDVILSLTDDEAKELVFLKDWWNNIGIDKQTDIMRICKELSREGMGTNKLWLQNTKGKHNDRFARN